MGLLNTATSENKKIDQNLIVSYSKKRVSGNWSAWDGMVIKSSKLAWEYHRYATIQYRYVGMSYEAACEKAQALIQSYTRDFYIFDNVWTRNKVTAGQKVQGTIEVHQTIGHLYEVVVSINEDDVRLCIDGNQYFNLLFATENSLRRYDY